MAIYRKLQSNPGFRNPHSFYRQFRFCLKHKLIELSKVEKKWGIPTKIYRLTNTGRNLLQLFKKNQLSSMD
jgi:DNA-binding PadR family transcriptional regulator